MTSKPLECAQGYNSSDPKWHRHVVSLQNVMGRFFYHHVMEGLTRFFMVEGLLRQYPDMKTTGMQQNDLLTQLGIADRHVESGCAQYLWIPESVKCMGPDVGMLHISRGVLTRMVQGPRYGEWAAAARPYIVVVKRVGGARSIANMGELLGHLNTSLGATYDFRIHHGNLPLSQQFALFHYSRGVVAPHGAGLSLIMSMKKASAVVEFLTANGVNLCYLLIAFKLELNYVGMIVKGSAFQTPMTVNITEALGSLQAALPPSDLQ